MDTIAFLQQALILVVFFPISVVNGPGSCKYEDPVGSAEFQACLQLGDRFVKRHAKALRKGRNGYCSLFSEFQLCMTNMLADCPSLHRAMPADWLLIYEVFQCACVETGRPSNRCQEDIECFEEQYGSILGKRCDAFFRFNIKQGTREKCHFLSENVYCKEALVASACGERSGLLAFHVAKMTLKNADRCDLRLGYEYQGFQYTPDCPINFMEQMERCEKSNIAERKMKFSDSNDLIVISGIRETRRACGDYESYEKCVKPLEAKCPTGTRMVYEFDSRLRTYVMKLKHICVTGINTYRDHLTCYQTLLENQTLATCYHIYQSLLPLINQLTAFEFYCLPEHTITQSALRHLTMLTRCYDGVLTKGCGKRGSEAIIGLISEAFMDPYYLRYKYHPNCALHGITTSTVSTSTSTVATTTAFYSKSLKERSDDARAFNDARSSNGNVKTNVKIPISIKSSCSSRTLDIAVMFQLLMFLCLFSR